MSRYQPPEAGQKQARNAAAPPVFFVAVLFVLTVPLKSVAVYITQSRAPLFVVVVAVVLLKNTEHRHSSTSDVVAERFSRTLEYICGALYLFTTSFRIQLDYPLAT